MSEKLFKYIEAIALNQKTKEELIGIIMDLQTKLKELDEKNTELLKTKRDHHKKYEKEVDYYKGKVEEYLNKYAEADAHKESYKRIVDLKLGKSYNINAPWVDKIVFVLKEAGRPLRSSEIIEILTKNDITFRTLTNKVKGLSAHLTKALKYGRIVGEKQKGQNGYLYSLPE